jgi:hypothetical protein
MRFFGCVCGGVGGVLGVLLRVFWVMVRLRGGFTPARSGKLQGVREPHPYRDFASTTGLFLGSLFSGYGFCCHLFGDLLFGCHLGCSHRDDRFVGVIQHLHARR